MVFRVKNHDFMQKNQSYFFPDPPLDYYWYSKTCLSQTPREQLLCSQCSFYTGYINRDFLHLDFISSSVYTLTGFWFIQGLVYSGFGLDRVWFRQVSLYLSPSTQSGYIEVWL